MMSKSVQLKSIESCNAGDAEDDDPLAHHYRKHKEGEGDTGADGISRSAAYNDAYQYLMRVKSVFRDRRKVYEDFLDTMKLFKQGRMTDVGVIERIKHLFEGHKDLIMEFNMFVPDNCKISEVEIDRPNSAEAKRAEHNRTSTKQTSEPRTSGQSVPRSESRRTGNASSTQPSIDFEQAINFVNKIKNTFKDDQMVYKNFLEILNRYRKNAKTIKQVDDEVSHLFKDYPSLLEEFRDFLPPDQLRQHTKRAAASSKRAEEKRPGKKPLSQHSRQARGKATVRKSAYAHEKEAADSSAKEQQQQQRSRQQTEPPISPFVNQFREMQVFDKMRNRLRSMGTYADFLKCVLAFNIGAITKMELECLAYDLVGKQSDLYSNFSELMVRCESLDSDEVSKKEGRLTQEDIPKMKSVHGREQYLRTPTSELDLTACQKAGESYRLLPQEFPRAPAKGRTYLCNRVLNEDWVNVTSGSEDYSYKAMRKNQYEEALFRCEDDRFELDMVIETNKSAIACLEELSEHLEERFSDRRRTKPLDPAEIGSVQLRAIERIYGDCKHELRDKLFRHPLATVPVVLQRLKQKLEEWQKLQQEMQPIWAKVYEKNYSRSLDHRSFYFKQEDKRALSQKELLREVHDRARARRCGSIGSATSEETADMAFVDQYRATHDDAYAILKHYLSLQMQPQDVEKMLWFWRSFVERFYNVIRPNDGSPLYDSLAHQSIEGASTRAKEGESLDTEAHERHDGSTPEGYRGTRSPAPLEDGQQPTPQEPGSPSDDENADDAEGKQYQRPRSLHQQQWQQDEQQEQDTEYFDQNEEGMQEGEDEEQEDEEDGAGRYTGCKPIAPRLVDSRPVQKGVSPNQGSKEIFFGHDAFYILFKLHHLLLQRLAVARDSASQADKASWKSEEANETEGPHSERDVLTHFFELLSSLLSSTIDTTTYEDDCRTLLGAKSYVLFTLDRLVQKIYQQLQTLVADDTSVKLAMLHEYETSRSVEFNQMVYQSNACMLLGQEDTCYWMSMVKPAVNHGGTSPSAAITEGGSEGVNVRVVDSGPDKGELPSGTLDSRFARSLKEFVTTQMVQPEDTEAPLYLQRTLSVEYRPKTMLEGTFLRNGLECKLCVSTMKVSYVRDTEDLFFRPKKEVRRKGGALARQGSKTSRRTASQMRENFHEWLRQRMGELPPSESSEEEEEEEEEDEPNEQAEDVDMDAAEALAGGNGDEIMDAENEGEMHEEDMAPGDQGRQEVFDGEDNHEEDAGGEMQEREEMYEDGDETGLES